MVKKYNFYKENFTYEEENIISDVIYGICCNNTSTSVFNTKVAKADARTDIAIGTKNLNNTLENSAKIGDQLMEPEKGWKRYDNTNKNIEYYTDDGSLKEPSHDGNGTKYYKGTSETLILDKSRKNNGCFMKFKFKGTKFRIVNYVAPNHRMKVIIDGKEDSLNNYVSNKYGSLVLAYEKKDMEYGEHTVEVGVGSTASEDYKYIYVDAIDIGDDGDLVAPIQLNKTSITLPVGTSDQLTTSVLSEWLKNYKYLTIGWRSSDYDIVKVDDSGKITAMKEGKAIITARINGGSISAQCEVNVTKGQVVEANSIAFKQPVPTEVGIWKKDGLNWGVQVILNPIVSPENAVNKDIIWTSSDESLVKVSNSGILIPNDNGKEGVVTITASIKDTDIKATCNVQMRYWKDNEMVTLNKETLNLNVGNSEKLTPQIKYFVHDAMTLISSDDSVAKTDKDGNVIGVKEGTAKISVIVHGDFGVNRIVKDLCVVTVK